MKTTPLQSTKRDVLSQTSRSSVKAAAARRQLAFEQEVVALAQRAKFAFDLLFSGRPWRSSMPRHQALEQFTVKVLVDFARILERYPGVQGPMWGRGRPMRFQKAINALFQGPTPSETVETWAKQRARTLADVFALKPSKRRGGQQKFTDAIIDEWLVDIDRRMAALAARGLPASSDQALKWAIRTYWAKRHQSQGLSKPEAKRLADVIANGPLFRTRRVQLARLRSVSRKPQS